MPKEISSIIPQTKKVGDKKVIAGKTTVQQPEEIKFYYDLSAYTTYEQEGFQPPLPNERFDTTEREFLKQVNLDYGKVKVKITNMIRQKQVDPSTNERRERKEYITFESQWFAHDYFGSEIRILGHIEGQYWKQTRRLVNQLDKSTGRMHSFYEKGDRVMAYTIPFSKANVDKYLLDPHPFGPDSENITDPEQVTYYGKFSNEDHAMMSSRDNTYSYEQIILPSWHDFCELTRRPSGPRAVKLQFKNYKQVAVEEQKLDHVQ